jgi:hypothetical protein
MARRRKREPRPPMMTAGLLATFADAQDQIIQVQVNAWRARLEEAINSEASCRIVEASLCRQLELHEQGRPALEPSGIVDAALAGHGPADAALRRFIGPRSGDERVNHLPAAVREYIRHAVDRPRLPVAYHSRAPQIANDFVRNIIITGMVDAVKARWPSVPRFYSTSRHRSAAYFVGVAFGLKERQTVRICEGLPNISGELAKILLGFISHDPGPSY